MRSPSWLLITLLTLAGVLCTVKAVEFETSYLRRNSFTGQETYSLTSMKPVPGTQERYYIYQALNAGSSVGGAVLYRYVSVSQYVPSDHT